MKKSFFSTSFSIILLIVGISICAYVFYKSQIILKGVENDYLLKFYFLSIFLIIIGIIGFFIKVDLNLNIALIFFSVIITIYFSEFILNILPKKKNNIPAKILEQFPNYDQRDRYQVYLHEKKTYKNKVAVLPVPINMASENRQDIIPLSGHSDIRTIFCNELGYYIIFKSDKFGFRNPRNEWNKEIKYLIVGDSMGHGMCVEEQDTITGQLRNKINKNYGVLNLSMWGNGPLLYYATLREYIKYAKPEKVFWFHSEGNDFSDLETEKKSDILMKYYNNENYSQNLANKQNQIDDLVMKLIRQNEIKGQNSGFYQKNLSFKIISFIKLRKIRKLIFKEQKRLKVNSLDNIDMYKKIIIKSKILTEKNGGKFYFVDIPDIYSRIYTQQKNLLFKEKQDLTREMKAFINKEKINYIEIYNNLLNSNPDLLKLFPFDGQLGGHFNPKGYSEVSRIIFDSIK